MAKFVTIITMVFTLSACTVSLGSFENSNPTVRETTTLPSDPNQSRKSEHRIIDSRTLNQPDEKWTVKRLPKFKSGKVVSGGVSGDQSWFLATPRELYRSHNGGLSWETVSLTVPSESEIRFVKLKDSSNWWVVTQSTEPLDATPSINSQVNLFSSSNGGMEWHSRSELTASYISGIYFNRDSVWLTGAKFDEKRKKKLLLQITDQNVVLDYADRVVPETNSSTVAGLAFTNESTLYLSTGLGTIFRSADGGQNWSDCSSFPSNSNVIKGLEITDELPLLLDGSDGNEGIGSRLIRSLPESKEGHAEIVTVPGYFFEVMALFPSGGILLAGNRAALGVDDEKREFVLMFTRDFGRTLEPIFVMNTKYKVVSISTNSDNSVLVFFESGEIFHVQREDGATARS